MAFAKYRLEATELFEAELEQALNYIEVKLSNPEAADQLATTSSSIAWLAM